MQVSLTTSWGLPTAGTTPTSYEVQWTVVGGPQSGTTTALAETSARSQRVTVPAPADGAYYRWQVRSRTSTATSAWATARVVVTDVVGRRAARARAALATLGLPSSTFAQPTTDTTKVGRVVSQSLAHGRAVLVGSSIALGVGTTP
jgi:hypothetical protein